MDAAPADLGLSDPTLVRAAAFVDGAWVDRGGRGRFAVDDPATGARLAELPRFGAEETRAAIEVARRAFMSFRDTTAKQRGEILRRWYELMVQHREDLARIITREEGKPLAESRGEIDYAASFVLWFSEEAKRVYGELVPAVRPGQRILVLREPIGVCAAITPWNFPAAMVTRKVAPALAAGCAVVLKPAEQTPLTALALAELARRAGLPAGALNVVTGALDDAPVIGAELTASEAVRKLTFTGSTEVGRLLLRQSADTIKKCSMELGGNAPFIVFDDADLDLAADGALAAKFRNTGQACTSANRILVASAVFDAFAEKLGARVARLVVGNGLEDGVQIGPLIDQAGLAKVEQHVADATARGARVLLGGARHALGGTFYAPTVLAGATAEMRLAQEETFGPVAPLFRFETEAEAIALANATEYGLCAYFYARDGARIWRVARALESGMVGVNCGLVSNEVAPFGGVKQSGLGREGSRHGIEEFVELKYVSWEGLG